MGGKQPRMIGNGRKQNWEVFPPEDGGPPSKTFRKVVAIFVKSRTGRNDTVNGCGLECDGLTPRELDGDVDHVIATEVVDLEDFHVIFWILSKTPTRNLGFEAFFLQGAAAAIVMLELSNREAIRSSVELLRNVCKEFPIPVMLVVGDRIAYDDIGFDSFVELAKVTSKVVAQSQHVLSPTKLLHDSRGCEVND
jgi:hypothetical protein